MSAETATESTSRGRLTAFRVIAGIGGALATVSSVIFVIPSFVDEDEKIHVVHNIAGLSSFVLLMGVPLLLLAWRPRQVALLRLLLAGMVASFIGGLMGGDFFTNYAIPFVVIGVLLAISPDRGELLRFNSPNLPLLAIALVGSVSAVAYATHMADLQHGPASDPHVEFHHWSGMAVTALLLVLAGAVSSLPGRAVRTARLLTGLAGALLAVGFLSYPDAPGSADTTSAVALLVMSVAYLAIAELVARDRASGERA